MFECLCLQQNSKTRKYVDCQDRNCLDMNCFEDTINQSRANLDSGKIFYVSILILEFRKNIKSVFSVTPKICLLVMYL